jgi:hypothetical protein
MSSGDESTMSHKKGIQSRQSGKQMGQAGQENAPSGMKAHRPGQMKQGEAERSGEKQGQGTMQSQSQAQGSMEELRQSLHQNQRPIDQGQYQDRLELMALGDGVDDATLHFDRRGVEERDRDREEGGPDLIGGAKVPNQSPKAPRHLRRGE